MNILCLCPVYGHPRHLIETAIECFNRQTHPVNDRELLILDDLGTLKSVMTIARWDDLLKRVSIMVDEKRSDSLPEKYNRLAATRVGFDVDAFAVWEIDDLYLPDHLTRVAASLEHHEWCHPNRVWSTYTGSPELENASGRFHAALAFRKSFVDKHGGWPITKRADFDQQMLAKCRDLGGPRGIPDGLEMPQYVFRWTDTGVPHGQGTMRSPDDETWYDRYAPFSREPIADLVPRLDTAAERTFAEIALRTG